MSSSSPTTTDFTHFSNLDWEMVKSKMVDMATSEIARAELRKLSHFSSKQKAEAAIDEVTQAQTILLGGQRPFMESLDLFVGWHSRIAKQARLKPLELKDVRHFLIECLALKEVLSLHKLPWAQEQKSWIMKASEPLSAIDQIMTGDGNIRTDASERLHGLHKEKKELSGQVQKALDRLVKQFEMEPILQDRFVTTREGRWVLPVKSGRQHSFDGIIHASSQSKQTVFMEPQEIVPINNRLRNIEADIEDEIDRLLDQLTKYLGGLTLEFEKSAAAMRICDQAFAKAQLANHLKANPPKFTSRIRLKKLLHPLLVLGEAEPVANEVEFHETDRILLLSGPNAGGKTVLLKSIGLAAQMSRCGLPICAAENSEIPFFKGLHIAIGDSQSVDEHLSTFAAHLKVLNQSLKARGSDQLLLIDEICGSTDPEEGTALARSFIDRYAENGVFAVVTSHLSPLKSGWEKGSGVFNGSLEYDTETGHPTYQFLVGVPGQSLAIQTARRVGVEESVVEKAYEYLSPERKDYQKQLSEIEDLRKDLATMRDQFLKRSAQAEEAKSKYDKLFNRLEREKDQKVQKAVDEARDEIDQMIQFAKVEDTFKKFNELNKIKSELPEIVSNKSVQERKQARPTSASDFYKSFPSGSKVYVEPIGRDGIIQGEPNSKGEIPILSNSMRLTVSWKQLRPPAVAQNPTHDLVRKSARVQVEMAEQDRTVDLRGMTVDEAIAQLEVQLDTAAVNDEDRVRVVHGHGTDALKKAVRSHLSRSVYVKKWTAGTPKNGGDGITWVELG